MKCVELIEILVVASYPTLLKGRFAVGTFLGPECERTGQDNNEFELICLRYEVATEIVETSSFMEVSRPGRVDFMGYWLARCHGEASMALVTLRKPTASSYGLTAVGATLR